MRYCCIKDACSRWKKACAVSFIVLLETTRYNACGNRAMLYGALCTVHYGALVIGCIMGRLSPVAAERTVVL